jgi:hypothetical protein
VHSDHTQKVFGESRYEVEKHKQNKTKEEKQTKSKEGQKQVPKQLCFNPILIAERVPFEEYINPRAPLAE